MLKRRRAIGTARAHAVQRRSIATTVGRTIVDCLALAKGRTRLSCSAVATIIIIVVAVVAVSVTAIFVGACTRFGASDHGYKLQSAVFVDNTNRNLRCAAGNFCPRRCERYYGCSNKNSIWQVVEQNLAVGAVCRHQLLQCCHFAVANRYRS